MSTWRSPNWVEFYFLYTSILANIPKIAIQFTRINNQIFQTCSNPAIGLSSSALSYGRLLSIALIKWIFAGPSRYKLNRPIKNCGSRINYLKLCECIMRLAKNRPENLVITQFFTGSLDISDGWSPEGFQ